MADPNPFPRFRLLTPTFLDGLAVHFCPLDNQCREFDAPPRLYVRTKRWSLVIALTPQARVLARNDGRWHYIDFRRRDP